MPEAILGNRVIVCEGSTESGIARALVEHWDSREEAPLATTGTVIVSGEGGSAPQRATDLRDLGYDCVYWGETDVPTNPPLQAMQSRGIETVVWAGDMNTEQRLMTDVGESLLEELWNIAVSERGEQPVCDQLSSALGRTERPPTDWAMWRANFPLDDLRAALAQAACDGRWYKTIRAGELVGRALSEELPRLSDTDLGVKLAKLRDLAYRN